MEIIKLNKGGWIAIIDIYTFLKKNNFEYFSPHIQRGIESSINNALFDLYFGLYLGDYMIGYGMLRGMDEGYDVPFLGIAVDKKYQGKGLGKLLMHFLECQCKILG